ncbi:MAG: DUF429 domain-containing protein [Geodermatophilaceae bacterium]|nr:DUF429 domain-containing protein [Geodermatophilaceae bacterium]
MAPVLGVDGCPGGWLAAAVDDDGSVRWFVRADAVAVLDLPAAVIGIDIPIGLPEAGRRGCDRSARRYPGMSPSAVFFTPVRAVLNAADYDGARAMCRARGEPAPSIQAWHILGKVAQVDAALGDPPDLRVVEVHPEVSFRTLDPRVTARKKSLAGVGQRIRALATFVDVGEALAAVPGGARMDDALDALVAAWSARRWRDGTAVVLPGDDPPTDGRGRPMRIVA